MRYKRLICTKSPHPSEINAIAVKHNDYHYIMRPQKIYGCTNTFVGMWGKLYLCAQRILRYSYDLYDTPLFHIKKGIPKT